MRKDLDEMQIQHVLGDLVQILVLLQQSETFLIVVNFSWPIETIPLDPYQFVGITRITSLCRGLGGRLGHVGFSVLRFFFG